MCTLHLNEIPWNLFTWKFSGGLIRLVHILICCKIKSRLRFYLIFLPDLKDLHWQKLILSKLIILFPFRFFFYQKLLIISFKTAHSGLKQHLECQNRSVYSHNKRAIWCPTWKQKQSERRKFSFKCWCIDCSSQETRFGKDFFCPNSNMSDKQVELFTKLLRSSERQFCMKILKYYFWEIKVMSVEITKNVKNIKWEFSFKFCRL